MNFPGGSVRDWVDMKTMDRRSHVLALDLGGDECLKLEVFIYVVPRGQWRMRFALPYFLDKLFGSERATCDWFQNNQDIFQRAVKAAGLETAESYIRSIQPLIHQRRHEKKPLPNSEEKAAYDSEYPVNPPGLFFMIFFFQHSKAAVSPGHPALFTTTRKIGQALIKRFR